MTRLLTMVFLVLLGTACQHTTPAPTTPSPTAPSSLSGVVYESTSGGRRPLAGAGIDVSPEDQQWSPETTTDADGHYEVSSAAMHPDPGSGLPVNLKVIATKAGYSQPCRAPMASATNGVLDIDLVSDEVLSTTGVPSSMPIAQPTLSGLVFEQTPQGPRPIPAAWVGISTWGDHDSAATRSDATGRYLLCGVYDTRRYGFEFGAGASGYVGVEGWFNIFSTQVTSFDIELKRP
jgi:hypothetical protein